MVIAHSDEFVLEQKQVLCVEGMSVDVFNVTIIKEDYTSFIITAEVLHSVASAEMVNRLLSEPNLVEDAKLRCVYDGADVDVKISMFFRQKHLPDFSGSVLYFHCSSIVNAKANGSHFCFLLPYVDIGLYDHPTELTYSEGVKGSFLDTVRFMINGIVWNIRCLFDDVRGLFSATDLKGRCARGDIPPALKSSGHAVLEVDSEELDLDSAKRIATDICSLLQLALAQKVVWSDVYILSNSGIKFAYKRSSSYPTRNSPISPIRNMRDHRIQNYLEGGWQVFRRNAQWWRLTSNWFTAVTECVGVEASLMTCYMLFDRISTQVLLNVKFSKQISDVLADRLGNSEQRQYLTSRLGEVLNEFTDNWDDRRSIELVRVLERWNNEPSYSAKIAEAYSQAGLEVPSPSLLKWRHALMHGGSLKLQGPEIIECFHDAYLQVLVLIFAMLNYHGKFFAVGKDDQDMQAYLSTRTIPIESQIGSVP